MDTFKVIIAGGRNFSDYPLLKMKVDAILSHRKANTIEIVSGMASGADSLGLQYAKENGIKWAEFPANWDFHGKSAGYIRNKKMAEYADALIAFHDGVSKGTQHMIDLAEEFKLKIRVVNY